jgi:Zn-dependent peptidase ImmA (M78 family)/DNA-binding XRE family transcriptional regulator
VSSADARAASTLFDPERLKLARQVAGLQKKELAEQVALTPAAITQYEQGQIRPRPAVVASLALALRCPVDYFVMDGRPRQRADASAAFFRSLRSTRQYEREQAAAKAELVWEACQALEQQVTLPAVDLPDLSLPEDASVEAIEEAAHALREAWGLGNGPLPHVVRLLEAHGVIVARLRADNDRIDAFSQWFADRPVVVLWDAKDDAARSRSDAAHELAHLALHHDPEPGNKRLEDQAQAFAGAALMPARAIADYLPRRAPRAGEWSDLFELKRGWGVSVANLLYRAKTLGVLSPQAHRRAMISMSERGWRSSEPGDVGPPEQPSLLRRALDMLADARGFGVTELARALHVHPERVEEVLGPALSEPIAVSV